jgi:hypothetical protein
MDKQFADNLADSFEAGRQQGFQEAIKRVARYAECVTGDVGKSCKWFASNCQGFIPTPSQDKETPCD